jgi:hypothetical protein
MAIALLCFSARSEAQSFPLTITCDDMNGRAVTAVQVMNGMIAKATIDPNGRPVVEYDPRKIPGISGQQQLFIYAHECGHHALGLVRGGGPVTAAQEQAADCYGIRSMIAKVGFTARDVSLLQTDMQQLDSGNARHLPWQARPYNLEACIASESPDRDTAQAAPRVDDCVLHSDDENVIVNESRDRLTIDGLYAAANTCARDMACTFTIETGTMPDADFDADNWRRFRAQKTRTEQHTIKAAANVKFPFHESIDTVPDGESVDFRVLKACK